MGPSVSPSPAPKGALPLLAGSLAGLLFLLPGLAEAVPALAFPLSLAGLLSASPLVAVRIPGRFIHALLALLVSTLLITAATSADEALSFAVVFGAWALVAGEVMRRQRSLIAGCSAGFGVLGLEALAMVFLGGQAPLQQTLSSPQVQQAFDQWSAQAPLEAGEAKAAVERVKAGIAALYPALAVVSAGSIVALNALALSRLFSRAPGRVFPRHELLLLRWPWALVVAFVGSGALLLAPSLHTVAWNGLVVTLFLFLLQGLSVLAFGLTRLFASEFMRAAVLFASILGPWAILLSLLGLFDQWFDFRGRFTRRDDDDAAGASAGSNDLR